MRDAGHRTPEKAKIPQGGGHKNKCTGGGNQRILHCKPPDIGKYLPTFQHD